MEQYYPVVQLGESKVKIAYSLGRGEDDNGWTCDKVDIITVVIFQLLNGVFSVLLSTFRDAKNVIDAATHGMVGNLRPFSINYRCRAIITSEIARSQSLGI
jgi:hypothetical protein